MAGWRMKLSRGSSSSVSCFHCEHGYVQVQQFYWRCHQDRVLWLLLTPQIRAPSKKQLLTCYKGLRLFIADLWTMIQFQHSANETSRRFFILNPIIISPEPQVTGESQSRNSKVARVGPCGAPPNEREQLLNGSLLCFKLWKRNPANRLNVITKEVWLISMAARWTATFCQEPEQRGTVSNRQIINFPFNQLGKILHLKYICLSSYTLVCNSGTR